MLTGADEAVPERDLIVLSHLRWDWVWQRPQHLMSRFGRTRRVWFVEQPARAPISRPRLRRLSADHVTRLWLEVPEDYDLPVWRTVSAELLMPELRASLGPAASGSDVWLYDPAALDIAEELEPRLLVYDAMDDLSSFADAPPEMTMRIRRALDRADVVFAGGRSLYRSAAAARDGRETYLFPSGVELEHYAQARRARWPHERPTAGYVGVIDERLDLDLLACLADRLPDWDILMVGPVTKIDPDTLPQRPNIHYLGMVQYADLPRHMARLDIALMPFALNSATRSISPTKTLEYLASGLPVVSTRVPDVVSDWSTVVHLADDGDGFADGCLHAVKHSRRERDERVAMLTQRYEWDAIASEMAAVMAAQLAPAGVLQGSMPAGEPA